MTQLMQRVEVRVDGRPVAYADPRFDAAEQGHVIVQFEVEHGHQHRDVRAELLDRILDRLDHVDAHRLTFCLPVGESELLCGLTRRFQSAEVHAAGSTCLVEIVRSDPGSLVPDRDSPARAR